MDNVTQLILLFIFMNVLNCIVGTIKSLCTVKSGIIGASFANALAYAVNTLVTFYIANYDISLASKVIIVGGCNLVGVAAVKLIEQKMSKDSLWKFELTVNSNIMDLMIMDLDNNNIHYYYHTDIGHRTVFVVFSETREDSTIIKKIANQYNAKMFANENAKIWQ